MAAMLRKGVLGCLVLVAQARDVEKVTPVEKVMQLLKSLSAKVVEEGKKEATAYDKYACFCKEQADNKLYAIEKSDKKIDKLDAKIKKLGGEVADLNVKIGELAAHISMLQEEIDKAQAKNDHAHAEYKKREKELAGCIDAITRAIEAMQTSKNAQEGDSDVDLAQLTKVSKTLPAVSRLQATAAIQKLSKPGKAHAYTYQSNDIIATLQELLTTFKSNKQELDEEEFARESAFEKSKLSLSNEKKFAEKDKAEHEAIVETKESQKKDAQQEHDDEKDARDADQSFLDVLTEECQSKAVEWDQRSKARAAELSTLTTALEKLETGVEPNYGANKKLNLIERKKSEPTHGHWVWVDDSSASQQGSAKSFLQVRSVSGPKRALQLLSQAAMRLQSDVLSAAVMKVAVSADHFVKVRGLIKDLISRLQDQAEAEQTHKAFCDGAMKEATDSRDEANGIIEEKVGAINVATAEIQQLKDEISQLESDIAKNMKVLNEATELRNEDKAENQKTITESQAGKEAVEFAITVLKEFYEGGGSDLLQTSYTPPNSDRDGKTVGDLAPDTGFSGEYGGAKANADGIIGLLDVILSDFERTEEVTTEQEERDAQAFELLEKDTKEDNAAKKKEIATKEEKITATNDDLIGHQEDKKNGQDQLANSKKELGKLKPMCVEGEETYAARVQKREKEIEALKEALTILDDWQK